MNMVRTMLLSSILLSAGSAVAQGPGMMPPGPGMMPPAPPALTKTDVEKLVVAIPEVAKAGGELSANGTVGADGMGQPSPEDARKVEAMLSKYGFTFTDFFMKMTVLMSTYMALKPEEFDRQLPREDNPEVQKLLNDPNIPDADKKAMRAQIAEIQTRKEEMRAQLTSLATDENKAVVRPMLAKVQKALETAEAESKKARAKMLESMNKAKSGPRRAPGNAAP